MILLPRPLNGTFMILCVLFNLHVTGAMASLTVTETPQTITIREGDQAMLVYQKAILPPPEARILPLLEVDSSIPFGPPREVS